MTAQPEPFSPPQCLAFVRRFGPCTLREISFAMQVSERRLRDHLRLHRDVYASEIDVVTSVRVWYVKGQESP